MSSRFTLRRTVTALAMGAAAAASLVITAPAAVADEPQTKLMRLLDECDKETFDAALPGLCTVDAGSVTFDRFTADLQRGGSGAWWINNRKETVDAGDTLHVVNQGGIVHTFTEVKTFGSGVIAAVQRRREQRPRRGQAQRRRRQLRRHRPDRGRPGTPGLDVVPAKGVHQYQCIFHPWMRSVVTVR